MSEGAGRVAADQGVEIRQLASAKSPAPEKTTFCPAATLPEILAVPPLAMVKPPDTKEP
jgi:hypothetical protein